MGCCAPRLPTPSSFPADPVGETLFKEGKNQTWGSLGPGVQKGKPGCFRLFNRSDPKQGGNRALRIWRLHRLIPKGFILRGDARSKRRVLAVPLVGVPTLRGGVREQRFSGMKGAHWATFFPAPCGQFISLLVVSKPTEGARRCEGASCTGREGQLSQNAPNGDV